MATVNTDRMMTPAEAADELEIPVATVQQYCRFYHLGRTPAIECVRFNRSYMIDPKVVREFKKNPPRRGRPPEA